MRNGYGFMTLVDECACMGVCFSISIWMEYLWWIRDGKLNL